VICNAADALEPSYNPDFRRSFRSERCAFTSARESSRVAVIRQSRQAIP